MEVGSANTRQRAVRGNREHWLDWFQPVLGPKGLCVLAVVLAAKTFEGKDRDMAETYFDVGLAASQLVTQVESMGLKAHFMGGIVPGEDY
jgi:hypothetical protein